jgi:hypothetical protein
LLELTFTTYPPTGAGPLMVIVPVAVLPPGVFVGAMVKIVSVGAVTVTVLVSVVPFAVAVTVTVVAVWTGVLVSEKVAVVAPAGIVIDAGTEPTALLLDERFTV